MPWIRVPKDTALTLSNPDGSPRPMPFSFAMFISGTITNDESFGRDVKAIIAAAEIETHFREAKPGDLVKLSQDQYDRMKQATESPARPYNPAVMKQAIQYLRAILSPVEDEQAQTELRGSTNGAHAEA